MQGNREQFFEDDDRHRILEAIEEQAKNIAMSRGGAGHHRLSDWLNAAEEVMPDMKKPTVKSMSTGYGVQEPKTNTSSILGMLFGGTVLLTLAGLGSFALYTVYQDVEAVKAEQMELRTQLTELAEQNNQLTEQLEAQLATSQTNPTEQGVGVVHEPVDEGQPAQPVVEKSEVETMLDARFKQLVELLDQRAGAASTTMQAVDLTAQPPSSHQNVQVQPVPVVPEAIRHESVEVPRIAIDAQAADAQVDAPASPTAGQEPDVPTVGEEATKLDHPNYWLFGLSENSLLLQLGSSVKAEGFDDVIKKIRQQPELAHVLTVNANGSKRYVLAYGPFTSKEAAKQASDRVKQEIGITPWVRKVGDVQKLAEKP